MALNRSPVFSVRLCPRLGRIPGAPASYEKAFSVRDDDRMNDRAGNAVLLIPVRRNKR
jgi:hypothetical protein